jgi:hypothetical protein
MPDKVCYTAIFGDYDDLKEPLVVTPGWRYVCYTDQDLKSDVWEIIKSKSAWSSTEIARSVKLREFEFVSDKYSIYIDGTFTISCDLNEFWDNHFVSPMTVINHPIRTNIYTEADICLRTNRGEGVGIQIKQYMAEGMPVNCGVIQSGILLREKTDDVISFCRFWADQIMRSTRDQIGFAYAEWKLGVRWPRIIGFDYRTSKDFIFKTHKHRRHASPYRNN